MSQTLIWLSVQHRALPAVAVCFDILVEKIITFFHL